MNCVRVVGWRGLAVLLIVCAFARADKVKVPLKDVPKAVLDSIKEKFPRAELTEATKETEDGKTTYEIALKDGGRTVDVAATAAGKITEIETALDAKALPAKVRATLTDKYPKAIIKKAEEIIEIKDGTETKSFEVVVMTTAEKSVEVKMSPDGRILKEEEGED